MTKEKLKPIDTSKYKITDTGQVLKTIKDEIICKENAELRGSTNNWHKVADGDLPNDCHYVWTNVGAGYYDDG